MARSKSRFKERKDRKDKLGIFLIVVVLLCMLIGGGIILRNYFLQEKYDSLTFCPTDKSPSSLTIVLVDVTDTLNERQKTSIFNALEEIRDDVGKRGKLEVFLVKISEDKLLEPLFDHCNPGRGKDVSVVYGNPGLVEKRWKRGFSEPLTAIFKKIIPEGQDTISPLMESIQSVALSSFDKPMYRNVPKKLFMISDMLQNTQGLSHYQGIPSFESFRKLPYYKKVRCNLSGTDVGVFYIRRDVRNEIQGRTHVEFWQGYFQDQGARLTYIKPISG